MSKRLDVISGRQFEAGGQTKTHWSKCGSAWVKDDGKISVKLDTIPLNGEMLLVEPRPFEERGGNSRGNGGGNGNGYDNDPTKDW